MARESAAKAFNLRVRGLVQGVGFRPTVARLAKMRGLRGYVLNDGDGVLIHVEGDGASHFASELVQHAPPLSRIDRVEAVAVVARELDGFRIVESDQSQPASTGVVADAASCAACLAETSSPYERRYRYPFTNCTHCGPRFSIIEGIPYDRPQTTMRRFEMCSECEAEYEDEGDRRYHAEPIACHRCGPRVWLERSDGRPVVSDMFSGLDPVDAVATLLQQGEIVGIRGVGGYHLACDATNPEAVDRLRARKVRETKPFALMARDREVIDRYARVSDIEFDLLRAAEGPIVLLAARAGVDRPAEGGGRSVAVSADAGGAPPPLGHEREPRALASGVAPGTHLLGFMLPYTPLHALVMKDMDVPVVLTSGNRSDEPQCTGLDDARARMSGIADYFLHHDRDIAHRVDDSVLRVAGGQPTVLRHARGYAPGSYPAIGDGRRGVAMGGDLKAAIALARRDDFILSQHLGDLDEPRTRDEWERCVELYLRLFELVPEFVAVDAHPAYVSRRLGVALAERFSAPVVEVQHHHAHLAACLVEHGVEREVVGILLDGIGWGSDGTAWGGELFVGNIERFERVASLEPRTLLGGDRAAKEPWRNSYAQLVEGLGWDGLEPFADLEPVRDLRRRPVATLDALLASKKRVRSSSAGRLFDAVAGVLGLHRERLGHAAQAAMALEALAHQSKDTGAYPFAIAPRNPLFIDSTPMWRALLEDVGEGVENAVIARRFHTGLAQAFASRAERTARERGLDAVVLSGGCFANSLLTTELARKLGALGLEVLTHRRIPPGDGGLALGQAAVARTREGACA